MRQLKSPWREIFASLAFAGGAYFIVTASYTPLHPIQHGPLVVGWGLVLCFGLYPMRKNEVRQSPPLPDLFFMVLAIFVSIYSILNANRYLYFPQEANFPDFVVASLWVILSAIAMIRCFGPVIPILLAIAFFYAYFGPHFPGIWAHRGFSLWRIMEQLQTTNVGFWGALLWVLTTVVPLFMILSSLLFAGVGAQTLIDLAKLVGGRVRGGAAQIAVLASALMGMISGSAVANVATTGAFTIPTMKKMGYKPEFAAAVECTASSGGLIAPPIMGAGAFIMAEILGLPYLKIVVAAIIPATIYFVSVAWGVYIEAGKLGLGKLPKEELPSFQDIFQLSKLVPLVFPIALLLFLMAYMRLSVNTAGFWTIISAIVCYVFMGKGVKECWSRIQTMGYALKGAGVAISSLIVMCIMVQILVSLLALTGVAVVFTGLLVPAAKTSLILVLALTALATLVLGMGLPVTAAYIVAVSVLGVSLANFGIELLSIHMFIFYVSMLAAITPPVCAAVYVAAPIANSKMGLTAIHALTLASSAYVVAFLIPLDGRLLMQGEPFSIILRALVTIVGSFCLCVALRGGILKSRVTILQRALVLLAAAGFIIWDRSKIPISMVSVIGIGSLFAAMLLNFLSTKSKKGTQEKTLLRY